MTTSQTPQRPHCVNCGVETRRLSRGHCLACYTYLARSGRERPLRPHNNAPCAHCGYAGPTRSGGRCPSCYMRWKD